MMFSGENLKELGSSYPGHINFLFAASYRLVIFC